MRYFQYSSQVTDYLISKDEALGSVIKRLGHINREVDDGLFHSIIHQIIAQQISNKAQAAVWQRVQASLGTVTPSSVLCSSCNSLRAMGLSRAKASYVLNVAQKVSSRLIDLSAIERMPDEDAIRALTSLKGVGKWTAQMVLIFGQERPNVLSRQDAGIKHGMKIVYGRDADDNLFDDVYRSLSPYCSVASLYFWQTAAILT